MNMTSTTRISTFLAEYLERTRRFSRNTNHYVLNVIGMDMIHGSFSVLFNRSILAIGFDIHIINGK